MQLRFLSEIEMSHADISSPGISDGFAKADKAGDCLARRRSLEHLLVATDLTERSDRALQRAVDLAAQLSAQLNVLHVIEAGLPRRLAQRRRVEARALVREQLKHIAVAPSADITVNVRTGEPAREITREALELGSAAIILGHRRAAELDHYLISTTAARILRQGELPVLLVSGLPDSPYRRAIVEIGLSQSSTLVLGAAYRLAPGARPYFIHVYADDQDPVLAMLGSGESRAARLRRIQRFIEAAAASQHAEAPAFKTASITISRGPRTDALLRSVKHSGAELLVIEGDHTRTVGCCSMLFDWQLLAGREWDVLVIPASLTRLAGPTALVPDRCC